MLINEHIIQFQGRATLEAPIEIGHNYQLMIEVSCNKIEKVDLANGSYNFIYKVKPFGSIALMDDVGVKTAKTKQSKSQTLRIKIENVDDYDVVMDKVLRNFEAFYEFTRGLD